MKRMDILTEALVLKAAGYGENDRVLTLLTASQGRITAGIKGVRKAGAKLKYAAQPFCFAQYSLALKGSRYTVTNCSECESFYDLQQDIVKYYAGCVVLEVANNLTYEGADCTEMLLRCVKTLTAICQNEDTAIIRYLMDTLRDSGYGLLPDKCEICGKSLVDADKLRIDLDTGAFTCYDCGDGVGTSGSTYNLLRFLDGRSYDETRINEDAKKRALKLIRRYASYKMGMEIKSLDEYIQLL
ncbi:MAG: DNA repair protein RecO [Clostridia bacterium]|nr:DNA repair protein RecO [Clostridia bacterium]